MEDLSGIDASPGGLTWVLRPNGQWWPGRVLALDQLPAGCRQPSRKGSMGTPIQLLGKEDWSVDWYNLEKSMRVKAFRCGEFDEFIERAEASVAHSRKKRSAKGKNVSRNDAILHALRLEKLCSSDRNKKTSNGSMNSILKAKSNVQAHSERSHELALIGNASLMESDTTDDFYNVSPLSSSKDSCSSLKHKHSLIVQDLGFFGKEVSRRLRTHVWTSNSTKVSAFEYQRAFPGLSSFHGISQNRLQTVKVSSKDANFLSVNDDTPGYSGASCEGTLFHVCESKVDDSNLEYEMDREVPGHSDRSLGFVDASPVTGKTLAEDVSCPFVSRKLQHSSQADLSPQLHGVLAEIYSTTSATQVDHATHSEGKRNLSLIGNVASESSIHVEMESPTFGSKIRVTKGQSVSDAVEDIPVRFHCSNDFSKENAESNGIDVSVSPLLLGPTSSSLYDVKLNVNTSYHGPHAHLVSLVSKSSSEDIVGFPILVEVLEDGFFNVENLVGVSPSSKRKHSRGKKSGFSPRNENLVGVSPSSKRKHSRGKKSGFSPRKTRKISLITVDAKGRKPVVKMNRGLSMSCVPMSILFSRLNEALRG